ncbi:MAG: hypothetical protein ACPG05_00025 [Bdellovibrionales bacterium]
MRISTLLQLVCAVGSVSFVSSALAHPHLDEVPDLVLVDPYDATFGSVDGFGDGYTELYIDQGVAEAEDLAAGSACSGFNAACYNVDLYHTATRALMNNDIDWQFELYAEWWWDIFWQEGILATLPQLQEQVSMTQLKRPNVKADITTFQKEDDAVRMIQEKKVEAIATHTPSEEFCKYVTIVGGVSSAKQSTKVPFHDSMDSIKHVATMGDSYVADKQIFNRARVNEFLCRDPGRIGAADGALDDICEGIDVDDERPNIGDLADKGNWDENDHDVASGAVQSLFLSNRPARVNPVIFNRDKGRVAYMNHRSVLSREMLGSYCFMKSYQDQMGGSDRTVEYLEALLRDMNMTDEQIEEILGEEPSLYTQKKVMLMAASAPTVGNDMTDMTENVLRLSNMINSYKLSTMYDAMDLMYCNQMIAGQLFTDVLLPKGRDLQGRVDSLRHTRADADPLTREVNVVQTVSGQNVQEEGL